MGEPYLGEVRIVGFNFPPKGWALCNGQLLPINQNQALFSILGTTYGGNGRTNFALPDLRGRTPIHVGDGSVLGQPAGEEAHTLVLAELAPHSHTAQASTADADAPTPSLLAKANNLYANPQAASALPLTSATLTATGGVPHENMQPYLVLNIIIALQGIFPSRN